MRSVLSGAFGVAAAVLLAATSPWRAESEPPSGDRVVIAELFTSEGCSSCPPADTLLRSLVGQPVDGVTVLGLSEHVTYWDGPGWRDPFSSAQFTDRQSDYARARRHERIYTPQLIVDGYLEEVGSNTRAVKRAIATAAAAPKLSVAIANRGIRGATLEMVVTVHAPDDLAVLEPAELLVALTEDGLTNSVRGGENGGRRLTHDAVVRRLVSVGTLPGSARDWSTDVSVQLQPEWQRPHLKTIAFVQEDGSRRVIGAGMSPVTGPVATAGK